MISTMTATEIANKNKSLDDAEYCLENIGSCTGVITVLINGETLDTVAFGNIQDHDLKNILEAVIDNLKARLDELNELAMKEAQDAGQRF